MLAVPVDDLARFGEYRAGVARTQRSGEAHEMRVRVRRGELGAVNRLGVAQSAAPRDRTSLLVGHVCGKTGGYVGLRPRRVADDDDAAADSAQLTIGPAPCVPPCTRQLGC